jgi:aryl-alcohol dehydrogenase-like predicted oxidoreductase
VELHRLRRAAQRLRRPGHGGHGHPHPRGHLASSERHGRELAITANAENAAEEARARAAWEVLGTAYGTGAQAALRFGLACPLISTIVVGIGEPWHLDEALAAAETGPLPAAAIADLEQLWRTHPAFRS